MMLDAGDGVAIGVLFACSYIAIVKAINWSIWAAVTGMSLGAVILLIGWWLFQ